MNKEFLKRLKVEICLNTLCVNEVTDTLIHDLWDKNEDGILLCMGKTYIKRLQKDGRYMTAEYLIDAVERIKLKSQNSLRSPWVERNRAEDEAELKHHNL